MNIVLRKWGFDWREGTYLRVVVYRFKVVLINGDKEFLVKLSTFSRSGCDDPNVDTKINEVLEEARDYGRNLADVMGVQLTEIEAW